MLQLLLWIFVAVFALLLAGAAWEAVASAAIRRRFPPPGTMIDVGGRRLHLHCTGAGAGPTVIIETGRFNTSLMWWLVQTEAARFARVCTYDRAGYAWSEPDPAPRTGERVAADLWSLLQNAEIPGPYLLVGHSLGAMYIRCFAEAHPDAVAGLILVDPYTEGDVLRQSPKLIALQNRYCQILRRISLFGIPRLAGALLRSISAPLHRFPPAIRTQIIAFGSNAGLWRAVDDERLEVEDLARQLGGPGSLGEKPLVILSSDRCEMKPGGGFTQADVDAIWRVAKDSQEELTRLSSRGRLITLQDTGHGVSIERPEAVVEAIRDMLDSFLTTGS